VTYKPSRSVYLGHCADHVWGLPVSAAIFQGFHGLVRYSLIYWPVAPEGLKFSLVAMAASVSKGPGNLPAARVWMAKTGWFGSRRVQILDPLTVNRPNMGPYTSTRGFRLGCLDQSVPISGYAFRVSHSWSDSNMLQLIVK
jgi:hypothetical protein